MREAAWPAARAVRPRALTGCALGARRGGRNEALRPAGGPARAPSPAVGATSRPRLCGKLRDTQLRGKRALSPSRLRRSCISRLM